MISGILDPAPKYLIRTIPSEHALRCEICGAEILSSEEIVAAHDSEADLLGIVEPAIVDHLLTQHAGMFERRPQVVFAKERSEVEEPQFPDQHMQHHEERGDRKEAPPRSPDETDA